MPIDTRSDRPVYQQIADELRTRIHRGVYPPGSQLPSESDLVAEFDVTRITVRRALAVLENEGLAELVRGKGMFVPEPPPVLALRTSGSAEPLGRQVKVRWPRRLRHSG